MPPKKNPKAPIVDKTQQTKTKKNIAKEKPKPRTVKTPEVIKIRIQNNTTKNTKNNVLTGKNAKDSQKTPKLSAKQLALQHKIDLANEVVRTQLKKTTANEAANSKINNQVVKPVIRRKRTRQDVADSQNNIETITISTDSEEAFEKPPKRKNLRKMSLKKSQDGVSNVSTQESQSSEKNEWTPSKKTDMKLTLKRVKKEPKETPSTEVASGTPNAKKTITLTTPSINMVNTTPNAKTTIPSSEVAEASPNVKRTITLKIPPEVAKATPNLKKTISSMTPSTEIPNATTTTPSVKKTIRLTRQTRRTLLENTPDSHVESPSILDKGSQDHYKKSERISQSLINDKQPPTHGQSLTDVAPPKSSNNGAGPVDSRKTSVNSTSECLSWTKDISSSSTTTCLTVASSDIVRFDKVLRVKLNNIDSQLKKSENEPSSDEESSSSDSSDENDQGLCTKSNSDRETLADIDGHSLDLSVSSLSRDKSPSRSSKPDAVNVIEDSVSRISKALDKLSSNLKKIDMEILNWIGYQNEGTNTDNKETHDKMFSVLKEESNIIKQCQHIKRVLSDDTVIEKDETSGGHSLREDDKFVKPSNVITKPGNIKSAENLPSVSEQRSIFDQNNRRNVMVHIPLQKIMNVEENKPKNYDKLAQDKYSHVQMAHMDNSYDDDDALSLFAESITGMDSSRRNSTISSPPPENVEEPYIPQPVSQESRTLSERFKYRPTKIVYDELDNVKTTTVCEKQNADSTSINKEPEQQGRNDQTITDTIKNIETHNPIQTAVLKYAVNKTKQPCFMASLYKPPYASKSQVFQGMCFYNLISSCKNGTRCRFPHIEPDKVDIRSKLVKLSEDLFIQEYLLMKNWPGLRRKYGMLFVEECKRRDLTRFLVEMAIDFVMRTNHNSKEDAVLKVSVLEYVLLHLNSIRLETCEDLLKVNTWMGIQLCDVLMQTIANTQNFSRFKPVFLNLTYFMVQNKRPFGLEVASQILERVSILPYEEPLAAALIRIIDNTTPAIFSCQMMVQFEKQLACVNTDLYKHLLLIKERVNVTPPVVHSSIYVPSPCVSREVEQTMTNSLVYPDREKRYTSPDTTHLDISNKPIDEPIITRTINFDPSKSYTSNSSSESTEDYKITPLPKTNYHSWKDKSVYPKFHATFSPLNRTMRKNPMRKDQRQVTYSLSPTKFPHRSAPDGFP